MDWHNNRESDTEKRGADGGWRNIGDDLAHWENKAYICTVHKRETA